MADAQGAAGIIDRPITVRFAEFESYLKKVRLPASYAMLNAFAIIKAQGADLRSAVMHRSYEDDASAHGESIH